jgi:viologen exporter family transport system permease protein
MKRYFIIWWKLALATTSISFQSRFGASLFLLGKLLRYGLFLFFIVVLFGKMEKLAGYTIWQMIFIYASFNLLDTLVQGLFRNVYRFRQQIVTGQYDAVLTKPLPAFFQPLFGGSDALDLPLLFISLAFIPYAASHLEIQSVTQVGLYLLLMINGFILALGFHVIVLGIGILSTAVDNTIMLYRDLTGMGRFPIEIYQEPLRSILTFVIPVGIMMTFPSKALFGLLSWQLVGISFLVGVGILLASISFWHYALQHYTSASN